jgi:predicted transcriptional regulator
MIVLLVISIRSPETDVHECARIMSENQIRRIHVVDNGELVGTNAIGVFSTVGIFVNETGEALSNIFFYL